MPPTLTTDIDQIDPLAQILASGGFPPESDGSSSGPFAPRPSDPVFLALRPEPHIARHINGFARDLRAKLKLVGQPLARGRLHATLHGLCPFGRLTRGTFTAISDAVASLAMPPFLLGFDRVESFQQPQNEWPLVLRGSDDTLVGLRMLHEELVAALRKINFACRRDAFTPHLTLLYDRHEVRSRYVEEIRWTVNELVLLCSLYGRSQHILLTRWPLRKPNYARRL